MGNFYLMLSKQVPQITLSSKWTSIVTGRLPWTALPLLCTVLGAVRVFTIKDDVLWSAALLSYMN